MIHMSIDNIKNNQSVNSLASNRVQNAYNNQNQNQVAETIKQQQAPATMAKASAETVSVSDAAQKLNNTQEKAKTASGFDEKKVASIKKAIQSGTYSIDYERLAQKLVKTELGLQSLL